ncbi:unnamed protein product [Rotaria sp. Silwood1]|nr:unnamed protein product [Rotaria sp. Silwood1]
MAARVRASFADDDSISDHLHIEMVRINAPTTTSTITHNDTDGQTTLNESTGTIGVNTPPRNDFLITNNPGLIEGINREYEIPNLHTYRKLEIAYGLPTGSLRITNIVIRGIVTNAGSGRRRRDKLYRKKRDLRPFGIARNANTRTLYISDSLNHRVMRYLAGAAVGAVIAGGAGAGNANNQLNFPTGIYFDQTSNSLIIANRNNHNIVRWVIGAATRTVLAGSAAGAPGGTAALLRNPDGVTLDFAKNLYVADTGNNRIQLFKVGQTNGITIAGVPGLPNANPSSLRSPSAVKVDSQGNLYVADTINNRIQKFTCNQS